MSIQKILLTEAFEKKPPVGPVARLGYSWQGSQPSNHLS
jgi:hypothetical protein